MRKQHVIAMVLSNQNDITNMLAVQAQTHYAFLGETEPTNLRWENVLWDLEQKPNNQFF